MPAEWSGLADPHEMLDLLRETGEASDRKLRLFACACCRRVWRLLEGRSRRAVEVAEAFADDEAGPREMAEAFADAGRAEEAVRVGTGTGTGGGSPGPAAYAASAAAYAASDLTGLRTSAGYAQGAAFSAAGVTPEERATEERIFAFLRTSYMSFEPVASRVRAREAERAAQAELLRDLFADPSRPSPRADSAWLAWQGGTVRLLAEEAYRERRLPEGTLEAVRLAILADALEDAGCSDVELLAHLRGPGPHVRGCWALDLVLGRR